MGLKKENVENALNNYFKHKKKRNKGMYLLCLGYLEACLVQFEMIDGFDNMTPYVRKKANGNYESRDEAIIRLTQEFLNK